MLLINLCTVAIAEGKQRNIYSQCMPYVYGILLIICGKNKTETHRDIDHMTGLLRNSTVVNNKVNVTFCHSLTEI